MPTRLFAGVAAAALVALLLLSVLRVPDVPLPGRAALLALAAFTCWRPEAGFLVLATLLPLSNWYGRTTTWSGLMWPNVAMAAAATGYLARTAARPGGPPDYPLRASAATMAGLAGAALLVPLAVFHERLGGDAFREEMWNLLSRDLFIVNRSLPGVAAAALILEGVVLYYAAGRLAARSPAFRRHAPRALVAGGVLAAAVNLLRLWTLASRSDHPVAAALQLLGSQRINEQYADWNAAGSYFVLILWIAIGVVWSALASARLRSGLLWTLAAAAIASALWLTSSRTAMAAGLVAGALPLLLTRPEIRRRRVAAALALAAVLTATGGALAVLMPERGNQQSAATAVQVRIGMARAAFGMVAARPVFGIGAGEFYQRSGEFASPELLTIFPPARNENAHNNYLQILAELGLTGFAAFVWILGLAGVRMRRMLARPEADGAAWGLAAGLFAFGVTCLAGHPLLIPEVAGTFWLALGVVTGWGAASVPPTEPVAAQRLNWLVAASLAILAIALPLRARTQIADSNMEHVGIGLSAWERTGDGDRYRRMLGRSGAVFIPGSVGSVTVPLRAPTGTSTEVELRLDGRLADVMRVEGDRWTNKLVVLPSRGGPRYRKLELTIVGTLPEDGSPLLVGKVVAH
jgi:O-antigen ligase